MQYGVWTPERGIVGISDSDMATVLGGEIEGRDDQVALECQAGGMVPDLSERIPAAWYACMHASSADSRA